MLQNKKFDLMIRNTAEIVTASDLSLILKKRKRLRGYIGVEPSGIFHIGWMIWVKKLKELMEAGIEMTFLEATWHAWINDKFEGNMESIHACAAYIEHCLKALGIKIEALNIVKADETINDPDYWALLLKVAKHLSLARIKRATTIMGRKEKDVNIDFSKLIYPAMQVSDIFYLNLDICLGGTDQRKAHILAREVAKNLDRKKPVGIHTFLLTGLQGFGKMTDKKQLARNAIVDVKMSKSKPETCIFIHDDEDTIRKKIQNAYCPPNQVKYNPVIEIIRHILFTEPDFKLEIERPAKYGGSIILDNYEELCQKYREGQVHPSDLKEATVTSLNKILTPLRKYFEKTSQARTLYESLITTTISR
ncbi:MAG: tyrosine--tRNA ligase [Candidatus Bathyarchaeota archaeon]|nr:MAG: tyrosine--tRNA ligase [Candidatus Bathyarchaeota archaeon]